MFTIDAHQHFWRYDVVTHEWINDEMSVIRKDFLPAQLKPVLKQNDISGCVAVQADQSEKETDFLLQLAEEHDFIKGVVGWVDLRADNIKERLDHYITFRLLKGFRHILQGEAPEFMLHPGFINGIAALQEYRFTYDILVFPQHLKAVLELVSKFPDQPFVIDHIAKPYIKDGLITDWKKDMEQFSIFENVYCKISGMVTEADYHHWKPADFTPYLDATVNAFGTKRILYGSDWPLCLVAANYTDMLNIVKTYFASLTATEQEDFFGNNAIRFYQLED